MNKKFDFKKIIIIIFIVILLGAGITVFILKSNNTSKEENGILITDKKDKNLKENKEESENEKVIVKEEHQENVKDTTSKTTKENKTVKKTKKEEKKDDKKETKKTSEKEEKKKITKKSETTTKKNTTTKITTTIRTTKSKDQVNNELRYNIKAKYGVLVSYKDEVDSNYSSNYARPTKLYDDTEIYNHLVKIDSALSKYPNSFFYEIKNKWKQVTIDLVKNINGSASGLTDNRNPNSVVILINTGGLLFESTLHHEIMHYIDCYLANKMGAYTLESSMMNFNPTGFSYGNQNNDYVYRFSNPYYFLSAYAKSNYKEDRAVIFEDLMTRTWKREYHTKGNPINEKAKVISMQISTNLTSAANGTTKYWERFIEW